MAAPITDMAPNTTAGSDVFGFDVKEKAVVDSLSDDFLGFEDGDDKLVFDGSEKSNEKIHTEAKATGPAMLYLHGGKNTEYLKVSVKGVSSIATDDFDLS